MSNAVGQRDYVTDAVLVESFADRSKLLGQWALDASSPGQYTGDAMQVSIPKLQPILPLIWSLDRPLH